MELKMKETFKEGNKTAKKFKIDAGRTISVAGGDFDVYATPDMIRDIERTCNEYILEYADTNEDSVGTQVNISHVGATLLGMSVEISILVKSLDRRRVVFEVTVNDLETTIHKVNLSDNVYKNLYPYSFLCFNYFILSS